MVCSTGLGCANDSSTDRPNPGHLVADELDRGAPSQSTVVGTISLAPYPDTLMDGNLRVREVVLEPGGRIRAHAHDTRPAVVYVIEGEVVEQRSDSDAPVVRREGDVYFEGHDVVHWLENTPSSRVRALAVDITSPALKEQ